MTKRIDYNQVAPNGVKALGGVYVLIGLGSRRRSAS
jgi:hypothetical protein